MPSLLLLTGCSGPTEPTEVEPDRETVAVPVLADTLGVRLYDAETGELVGVAIIETKDEPIVEGERFSWVMGVAMDRARGEVLVAAHGGRGGPPATLFAVGVPEMELAWQERYGAIQARLEEDLFIETDVASGPKLVTDRWLLMAGFRRLGEGEFERGVLALEQPGRSPRAFLGGFRFVAPRVGLVGGRSAGEEGLLVVGGPRSGEALRLMIYGAGTLELRDSVLVNEPLLPDVNLHRLRELVDVGDGRHVIARTADSLFRVDVRAAEIVARVPRARRLTRGQGVVAGDPPRLFLSDRGVPGFPGSGELQVYDAVSLADRGRVDMSSEAIDTYTNTSPARGMDVGRDGERLYVLAGTASGTFGAFFAEASISVVDPGAMTLVDTHPIGGFGARAVYVVGR